MTEKGVFNDFFGQDEPRAPLFAMYALIVLMVGYHALVFTVIMVDDISTKGDLPAFEMTFEESAFSDTEEAYVQDQTVTMEHEIEPQDLAPYSGVGMLSVVISYSETSGLPFDDCDSVSATIPPTGASADWGNANTTLSGTSDDCSDIVLSMVWLDADEPDLSLLASMPATVQVDVELSVDSTVPGNDDEETVNVDIELQLTRLVQS